MAHGNIRRVSVNSQQTQSFCMTFVQCWTNVEDVGPALYKMLYKCFVFVGYHKLMTMFICDFNQADEIREIDKSR